MENLLKNSELIYKNALQLMYENKDISPPKALTVTVAAILVLPNAERILGDAYLDYINYKKELENGEFENFYDFFRLSEHYNENTSKKVLEKIVKFKREESLKCIIAYRLVKEHFSVENFEKYKEFTQMLEDDEYEEED